MQNIQKLTTLIPRKTIKHISDYLLYDCDRAINLDLRTKGCASDWRKMYRSMDGMLTSQQIGDRDVPDNWTGKSLQAPSSVMLLITGPCRTITAAEIDLAFANAFFYPGKFSEILKFAFEFDTTSKRSFLEEFHDLAHDVFCVGTQDLIILLQRIETVERTEVFSNDFIDSSRVKMDLSSEEINSCEDVGKIKTAFELPLSIRNDTTTPTFYIAKLEEQLRLLTNTNSSEYRFWLEATCSKYAWVDVKKRAEACLNTSLWLLESLCAHEDDETERIYDLWNRWHDLNNIKAEYSYGNIPSNWERIIVKTSEGLTDQGLLLVTLLDAWWQPWTKKDNLPRRIRNSILLLNEARNQQNDAIQLALLTSALEAMLGDKRADLTNMIAQRCAVLLEPEPKNRPACQKVAKQLYDRRSRILHGQEPFADPLENYLMRMIVSAVLQNAISHRAMAKKMGIDYTAQDLVSEIDMHSSSGQPLIGIQPLLVRVAWGVPIEKSLPITERSTDNFFERGNNQDNISD